MMVTALFVLPFAAPIAAFSFIGLRKRWARWVAAAGSVAGLVVWAAAVYDHPADPRWLPLLFLPPAVASAVALRTESPTARRVAMWASLIPLVAGLAFAAWLRLSYRPCV